MKKVICLMSLAGIFALGSCETNTVKNTEDNAMMDRRDTSTINQEFNQRGVPTEGIPDNNAIREDTINIDNSDVMSELPAAITDKIMEDESLRKKRLTNSRSYSEGGTSY